MKKVLSTIALLSVMGTSFASTKPLSCINYTVLKGDSYNIPVSTGSDPIVVQIVKDAIIVNGEPKYQNAVINGLRTYSNAPNDADDLWLYRDAHHIGKFIMAGGEPEVKMYTCK